MDIMTTPPAQPDPDSYADTMRKWERRASTSVAATFEEQRPARCNHEMWDGCVDDPSYAYCGFPQGHAGTHGEWIY